MNHVIWMETEEAVYTRDAIQAMMQKAVLYKAAAKAEEEKQVAEKAIKIYTAAILAIDRAIAVGIQLENDQDK